MDSLKLCSVNILGIHLHYHEEHLHIFDVTGRGDSRLFIIFHIYSIDDRSSVREHHGSRVTLFLCKNSFSFGNLS